MGENTKILTGNKGEWSEIYVFLKLLADGKLYAADDNLQKIKDIYYPVLKIIRQETEDRHNEYIPGQMVEVYINGWLYCCDRRRKCSSLSHI